MAKKGPGPEEEEEVSRYNDTQQCAQVLVEPLMEGHQKDKHH